MRRANGAYRVWKGILLNGHFKLLDNINKTVAQSCTGLFLQTGQYGERIGFILIDLRQRDVAAFFVAR